MLWLLKNQGRSVQAILDHTEDVAHNIKTFWFKPERTMRSVAGQFIELYLPHQAADARGQKHWFTLSSSPTEPLIAITTQLAEGRRSTFKQTLLGLQPGDMATVSEPMGDFVLPKDANTPLVFVAGGIGVTPMRSMIQWLVDTQQRRLLYMLYAASHANELAFGPLFHEYLGGQFEPFVTGNGQNPLTTEHILASAPDPANCMFYLSGPEQMVEVFTRELQAKNIASHRIVTDYFHGYTA